MIEAACCGEWTLHVTKYGHRVAERTVPSTEQVRQQLPPKTNRRGQRLYHPRSKKATSHGASKRESGRVVVGFAVSGVGSSPGIDIGGLSAEYAKLGVMKRVTLLIATRW